MVRQEVEAGSAVVVPAVVVIQSLVEGIGRRALDAVLDGTLDPPLDRAREDLAAQLLRASATEDVVDGLVAAEALLSVPSIVITSDPRDLARLLQDDERAGRVTVWDVYRGQDARGRAPAYVIRTTREWPRPARVWAVWPTDRHCPASDTLARGAGVRRSRGHRWRPFATAWG